MLRELTIKLPDFYELEKCVHLVAQGQVGDCIIANMQKQVYRQQFDNFTALATANHFCGWLWKAVKQAVAEDFFNDKNARLDTDTPELKHASALALDIALAFASACHKGALLSTDPPRLFAAELERTAKTMFA